MQLFGIAGFVLRRMIRRLDIRRWGVDYPYTRHTVRPCCGRQRHQLCRGRKGFSMLLYGIIAGSCGRKNTPKRIKNNYHNARDHKKSDGTFSGRHPKPGVPYSGDGKSLHKIDSPIIFSRYSKTTVFDNKIDPSEKNGSSSASTGAKKKRLLEMEATPTSHGYGCIYRDRSFPGLILTNTENRISTK